MAAIPQTQPPKITQTVLFQSGRSEVQNQLVALDVSRPLFLLDALRTESAPSPHLATTVFGLQSLSASSDLETSDISPAASLCWLSSVTECLSTCLSVLIDICRIPVPTQDTSPTNFGH